MEHEANIRTALDMKEGVGARVKRLFPISGFMNFDPFMLWDHFTISAGSGFPTHPHRGFEAITYLFEGSMKHEDNLGNSSTVGVSGAQRFTAGRGMQHSEMPAADGETRGIQLWINLPRRMKGIEPAYQQVEAEDLPLTSVGSAQLRTIVGKGSPLQLHTPVVYLDIKMQDGVFEVSQYFIEKRGLLFVVEGVMQVNGQLLLAGQAHFVEENDLVNVSTDADVRFMLCAGLPHREPVRQHGPYVD